MDFAISPKRKNRATGRYRRTEGDSEYQAYARNVSIRKNVLSTSFRSETQATDSTCSGCSANRAATRALRHRAPVIRKSIRSRTTALPACSSTLVRWCPPAHSRKGRSQACATAT